MPSSSARARAALATPGRAAAKTRALAALGAALAVVLGAASRAEAQQATPAKGFGLERLTLSPPGGGWVVMDALDMHGGLGGAMALTVAYAHDPLRVTSSDGAQRLTVVSSQAFADFGFAATYDRFRLSLSMDAPIVVEGNSGTIDNRRFTAPPVDPGTNPDTLSDARLGFDARLFGDAGSAFRLGAGAQLFIPNGNRSDYVTDGTYRAMGRFLVAGDVGAFTYAGQLGLHVRPLDDAPHPESPRGSEVLFGAAAGARLPVPLGGAALIVGPELHGATALASFLAPTGTALEGLLGARLEGTGDDGPQLRFKVATGAGLERHLGAPEWRLVFGIEIFNHRAKAPVEAPRGPEAAPAATNAAPEAAPAATNAASEAAPAATNAASEAAPATAPETP